MFEIIVHLYCGVLSDYFSSIWLNVSREYSPVPLRIHAAPISNHIISKH